MSIINQKEYLKKYLSKNPDKPKKKKTKKKDKITPRVRIIDDDADFQTFNEAVQEDLLAANEDAPQVVGIIDDRPVELRMDDFKKEDVWKPVHAIKQEKIEDSDDEDGEIAGGKRIRTGNYSDDNKSPTWKRDGQNECPPRMETNDDYSPPRRKKKEMDSPRRQNGDDFSSPRCKKVYDDNSPPIRKRNGDTPPRRKRKESDSPPRRDNKERDEENNPLKKIVKYEDNSPPRRRKNDSSPSKQKRYEDNSPPRKRAKDEDNSPPRRKRKGDISPPRRNNVDNNPPRRSRNNENNSPRTNRTKEENCSTRRNDVDSPPKRNTRIDDNSPPRRHRNNENNSPPRSRKDSPSRNKKQYSNSPRRTKSPVGRSKDASPTRRKSDCSEKEKSPSRRSEKKSRWGEPSSTKMTKTLDGKSAGLQNAKDLVEETQKLKKREEDLFKNMAAEVSGVNSQTIIRDRKTGKVRNLEEERVFQEEKSKEQAQIKEKYDKWGKGTKQVEDYNEKLKQDVYEMNKPLARYADDEDLERYLKEQEREGDPMLAYIKKKKKKDAVDTGKPMRLQYEGEFMPNRFGIRPGHKWDGVDRSSGYEKKWFEVQNSKQAQREEAYRWNTEDM